MDSRPTRVFSTCLLPAMLIVLIGCSGEMRAFSLSIDLPGSGDVRTLIEYPRRIESQEGWIAVGGDHEPTFTLREPFRLPRASAVLELRFAGTLSPGIVEVYDAADRHVGGGRFQLPAGMEGESGTTYIAALPLEPGAEIDRFSVRLTGGAGSEPRYARLESVSVTAPSADVTATASSLAPGSAALVHEWSRSGTWTVEPVDHRLWPADRPVSIEYRYDPGPDGPIRSRADLLVGASGYVFDLRRGTHEIRVYPAAVGSDEAGAVTTAYGAGREISIRFDGEGLVITRIGPADPPSPDPDAPIPADMGTILSYPRSAWRQTDHEVFRWLAYPDILIVDTADYDTQSRYFKRLAFYTEKEYYRGTLLTNEQLAGQHGYNAHNYSAAGLASFFSAAVDGGAVLNPEENVLRDLALNAGIIVERGGLYEPGAGGVLGVSQESSETPGLRRLLLVHEGMHGIYYCEPGLVAATGEQWDSLSPQERRYWELLFDGMHYDISDEYLVRNEYQAYLLQQPVDYAGWYMEIRSAERLRTWFPSEVGWIDSFLGAYAGTHLRQAESIGSVLTELTGYEAGDLFDLEPQ